MTNAARKLPSFMSVADFIAWPGDGTGTRYELVDGVLRAMAPASDTHNTIRSNIVIAIGTHLKKHRPRCRIVSNPGVQPCFQADWNFRVPDLGVTCAPNHPGAIMLPDPILLIEILSPSNAGETWDNIRAYATLPTVMELLVVHSTRVKAEIMRRQADGKWAPASEIVEAGGTVRLACIDVELAIADIYVGTYLVQDKRATYGRP